MGAGTDAARRRAGSSPRSTECGGPSGHGDEDDRGCDKCAVPIAAEVQGACELWGLDPLNVANEGKLLVVVDPSAAETALATLRAHPLGRNAAIIGEAIEDEMRLVRMTTLVGGERVVDWLAGEQLPRIC